MGVGSSNRKNQWQARILVHGKVTHLGYYETEEEAARVYDRCAGPRAQHGSASASRVGWQRWQLCGSGSGRATLWHFLWQ
jgi:hypothetical protein